MDKIIVTVFEVESEAYQALSKMKTHSTYQETLKFSQVGLLKKSNGRIFLKDGFDTGIITRDDTWKGGILGVLVGILGGPLGILLGMGIGTFAGAVKDTYETKEGVGIVKFVSSRLEEGSVAIISIVQEKDEQLYDRMVSEFEGETVRHDLEKVEKEIKHAEDVEKKLQKQAEEEM